jgi:hypothetical protein
MHATIRRYAGNAGLADQLAARKDEIVSVIGDVPGLRAYYLVKAGNDTISVTVCDDEAGTSRSSEVAAGWLRENMPDAASSSPEVMSGEVVTST